MNIRQLPLYKNRKVYIVVVTALLSFLVVLWVVYFPSSGATGISWVASANPSVSHSESSNYQRSISPSGCMDIGEAEIAGISGERNACAYEGANVELGY